MTPFKNNVPALESKYPLTWFGKAPPPVGLAKLKLFKDLSALYVVYELRLQFLKTKI
jgi:hypothetical protein